MRVRWARGVGLTHVNKHVVRRYIIDIKEKKKEARPEMMEVCAVKPLGFSGASGGSLEFLPVAINLDFGRCCGSSAAEED